MNTLFLLGVLITMQWGPPCGGNVFQGVPVPANQPKAEVRLTYVQSAGTQCQSTVTVSSGVYIFAIQYGQNATTGVVVESNRIKATVNPDGTVIADHGPLPSPPLNLRVLP